MLPRCGRAAHICGANRNCTMKCNKNLRENRKNRNCLENEKVVNMGQGFRGNCDSQGKLGIFPSLAEPDSGGFPRTSRRQIKSFSVQQFFKNAAEVWASSPHLRSKLNFAACFPCCNCIFWSCPIQTKLNNEHQGYKFRQGNGAIAARWQAKAGVEPPFAGRWRLFSLGVILSLFHAKHCS